MSEHGKSADWSTKRVLFVHQGAELYGSDKTFEQSVRGLREAEPNTHITVFLASDGPLVKLLRRHAHEVVIEPLFVLRKQLIKSGSLFNISRLVRAVKSAMAKVRDYDAVYINTTVIIDYIIACRIAKVPSILHIHELPTGYSRHIFRLIAVCSGASLIFNSQATRRAFNIEEGEKRLVVPNGTRVTSSHPLSVEEKLKILMIGRFNSWKGQKLLVSALSKLDAKSLEKVHVIMVGGVYLDQHHFKDDVITMARDCGLTGCIEFRDFVDDPGELYRWSTVVAVPSLLPEPFGLVAIEAMGHGRPVIASGHGGLAEIVIDNETGIHFHPGDGDALAAAIQHYIDKPDQLMVHGANGNKRYKEKYREDRYMTTIANIVCSVFRR